MMNCIIIDDEQYAIDTIRHYCKKFPYLNVIGEFSDPFAAISFIQTDHKRIDLVFLDVEMPKLSGIEILTAYTFPHVILATAHRNYAATAFEHNVSDYLLKPVSFDRFTAAVKQVHETQLLRNSASQKPEKEREEIYVKTDRSKLVKIKHAAIKYIVGAKNYSLIQTVDGEVLTSMKLKDFECLLPKKRFIRIHKSYIIHMDYFESKERGIIRLEKVDTPLRLGETYEERFEAFLQQII